jgi:hypothetical protein
MPCTPTDDTPVVVRIDGDQPPSKENLQWICYRGFRIIERLRNINATAEELRLIAAAMDRDAASRQREFTTGNWCIECVRDKSFPVTALEQQLAAHEEQLAEMIFDVQREKRLIKRLKADINAPYAEQDA